MITVMGATGHTGREITRLLLDAGADVRALGRSESRLAALGRAGARTFAGDANDAAYLTAAFRGADAVYTLLPFDPRSPGYLAAQARLSAAIVQAIRDSGVRHVVVLSSVGADRPSGTGFITSLYAHEQRLRGLDGVNVLVLRPGAFFESFEPALELIEDEGIPAAPRRSAGHTYPPRAPRRDRARGCPPGATSRPSTTEGTLLPEIPERPHGRSRRRDPGDERPAEEAIQIEALLDVPGGHPRHRTGDPDLRCDQAKLGYSDIPPPAKCGIRRTDPAPPGVVCPPPRLGFINGD